MHEQRLAEIDRELNRLQDVQVRVQRKHDDLVQERRRLVLQDFQLRQDPED